VAVATGSKNKPQRKYRKWRCPKCGSTYQTPIPVWAVGCHKCPIKNGRQVEMKGDD
jgi:protein-arginine kinase activator protein McsA